MRVLEQLVDYLRGTGSLSDRDVSWLRDQGFVPSLREMWPDGDERDSDDLREEMYREEQELEAYEASGQATLDQIEEEQIQRDLLKKAMLPPRSSKGARKSRRRRKNASATAEQQRDGQRHQAEKRRVSAIESQQGQAAVSALRDALNDLRPKVVVAALGVLAKIRPSIDSALEQKLTELGQHTSPAVRDAASGTKRSLARC